MNTHTAIYKEKKAFISNSTLLLLAFATAYFPRVLDTLGAPSPINFLHFATVPLASLIIITKTKTKDQNQIAISWKLISGLFILLTVMSTSMFLNNAGFVNLFINYFLLAEPFIILVAIVCIPMSPETLKKMKYWLFIFGLSNLVLAYMQNFLIKAGILRVIEMTPEDNIQGVFYLSGAGNYVSVSVSISFALFFLLTAKNVALWIRISGLLAAFYQLMASDSKQVLLLFLGGWFFLSLTKIKNISKALMYCIGFVAIIFGLIWCVNNLDFPVFDSFRYWFSRTDLYGSDGEAINLKLAGIRNVINAYESDLNWLFGLGPGHSIGRLGGWVLLEYKSLLGSLGATFHPVSSATKQVIENSWLAKDSSLFSPLFSWGGIWGDIGFLGLGSYLYLGCIALNLLGKDDLSKFLIFNVVTAGFILTQMEEPGYMLTIASLIGMRYQERQVEKRERSRLAHLPPESQ
ncbi:hypothetical protein NIES267_68070 [Calothrix parasitica NIES-267]|uniref:O-antigen polymerase n=1 Tax=Calothrix parasitica NIES-267 TaxID=1973488 RepID=A0A1Z4M1D7_9CYAN|nr:hypothetical protein NIES267_68070 [Calothrix parasitica NIES-267]